MISLSRQGIMSSAHRCKNSVESTMRQRGLSFSVSVVNSAIMYLACASVASLVAGSHLSSRAFHSSWRMITPYSVLATSVVIAAPFIGIDPEPRPGLHQCLQPGADKLRPPAAHRLGNLGINHADRPEREPQQRAARGLRQVEGGHTDAHAHVERAA